MSARVEDPVRGQEREPAPGDTAIKSYRYLRTAMVGLLVVVGVAVGFQSWRQGPGPAEPGSRAFCPPTSN